MNEFEKAFLPALRQALAEFGRAESTLNVEGFCGEAWRYHVELKDAKDFFILLLKQDSAKALREISSQISSQVKAGTTVVAPPPPSEPPKVFAKVKRRR